MRGIRRKPSQAPDADVEAAPTADPTSLLRIDDDEGPFVSRRHIGIDLTVTFDSGTGKIEMHRGKDSFALQLGECPDVVRFLQTIYRNMLQDNE